MPVPMPMHTPEPIRLDAQLAPADFWPALVRVCRAWLTDAGLPLRDVVLLLPFVELLPLARRAFAAEGGWQPHIETLQTLTQAAGPPSDADHAGCSGDPALDRLMAAELLRSRAGLAPWRQRDPKAFDLAVDSVVQAAQLLARGAAAQAPADREAWWAQARQALPAAGEGSAMAGLLSQVALEWAALAPAPASDRLLASRPAAWLLLMAGDDEPVARMLQAEAAGAGVPCLQLVADGGWAAVTAQPADAALLPPLTSATLAESAWAPTAGGPSPSHAAPDRPNPAPTSPFDVPLPQPPLLWGCADAEAEALAAASAVIDAVEQGRVPVALVAEDRLQVRRIRALLERAGLALADESGWTLDTTRAGARLMAWLRAAHPVIGAGPDVRLDWLKGEFQPWTANARQADEPDGDAPTPGSGLPWVDRLERWWRRGAPANQADAAPQRALARWAQAQALLLPLQAPLRRPLAGWLFALREALSASPGAAWWQVDEAGRLVWQALRLHSGSARSDLDGLALTLDEFTRWCDQVLADASFRPAAAQAQVVITPMARAMLRPFGAVVLPGADAQHLGPPVPGPSLLPDAVLRALGLPDAAARGERLARCFMLLLRQPGTVLLRRYADADGPMAASPWVARLNLSRRRQGLPPVLEQPAPCHWLALPAQPVQAPAPTAVGALPEAVSASAVEALRACPYRFFARSVLRLAEDEELDTDPGKREHGTVLHAALYRFHEARREAADTDTGPRAAEQLLACARAAADAEGLTPAAMLPFNAGLPAFAQRYLQWLAAREAQGWFYDAGELAYDRAPDGLAVRLRGRIDRVDRLSGAAGAQAVASAAAARAGRGRQAGDAVTWQLLDYKTGGLAGLRDKVKQPLEDTQLAFYAAQLLGGGLADQAGPVPLPEQLAAAYVALDERDAIGEVVHPEVGHSAQALLDGLAHEWPRLAAGAPLLALGEGLVCSTCEARGLCRRDHWWATPDTLNPAEAE